MTGEDLAQSLRGLSVDVFTRRGKFMQIGLSYDRIIVVNPMLTGAFRHCASAERVAKRTCVRLSLDDGQDLRYIDDKQMGMVYLTTISGLNEVPRLFEQGPDVLEVLPPDRVLTAAQAVPRRDQGSTYPGPFHLRHRQRLCGRDSLRCPHIPVQATEGADERGDRKTSLELLCGHDTRC